MNISRLLKVGYFIVLIILASCKGDDIIINTDNPDDNRILSGALPAINFSYTIADGLKELADDRLSVGADGLLSFKSWQDVSIAWEELAAINDVNESWSYSMSELVAMSPAPPLKATGSISIQEKVKFNTDDEVRYDKGTFKNGDLTISIELSAGFSGPVTISIPEITPLLTETFNATGFDNSFSKNFSLAGREVNFAQGVDSSYVTLNIESSLSFSDIPSGQMKVDFDLADIETEILFGYFGQKQSSIINEVKSIDKMEEDFGLASFELKEISYTLHTNNHMGVPFNIEASNIRFNRVVDGIEKSELLTVNGVSKIEMEVDSATFGSPIQPASNSFRVHKDNSNILEVSNPFPEQIIIDILSSSNPQGNIPNTQNFIGNIDSLYAQLEIQAPVWLKAKEYTRKDTIDFDFRKIMDQDPENADLIESLAMYLDFYNKLPFSANANLFIADADGNKIEDVLSNFKSLLDVGTLNSEGKVLEAKHTDVVVSFDKSQIKKFFDQKAMFLILETKTSSYNNETEFVKIFEDAGLDVSISFEASGRIPSF